MHISRTQFDYTNEYMHKFLFCQVFDRVLVDFFSNRALFRHFSTQIIRRFLSVPVCSFQLIHNATKKFICKCLELYIFACFFERIIKISSCFSLFINIFKIHFISCNAFRLYNFSEFQAYICQKRKMRQNVDVRLVFQPYNTCIFVDI